MREVFQVSPLTPLKKKMLAICDTFFAFALEALEKIAGWVFVGAFSSFGNTL